MNTSLHINLADILEERYPHGFRVPADISVEDLQDCGHDWTHDLDLEELLAENHSIGIVWNVQLVLDERPDLTEQQAWEVLQACQPPLEEVTDPIRHTVRRIARERFPEPRGKDAIRAYLARVQRQVDALPSDEATDPAGYGRIAVTLDAIQSCLKGDFQ